MQLLLIASPWYDTIAKEAERPILDRALGMTKGQSVADVEGNQRFGWPVVF
jgi:hypothetical protein